MSFRSRLRVDDDHPLTGWHMLAITLGFFVVVIAANLALAIYATGSFPGLVVENSYVASQNYNRLLAEARAQAGRGWTMTVAVRDGLVAVSFSDASGKPIAGLDVTAIVGRPSSRHDDRRFGLVETPVGYRANDPLNPGQWNIDIEARRGDELVFRDLRQIFVIGNASP